MAITLEGEKEILAMIEKMKKAKLNKSFRKGAKIVAKAVKNATPVLSGQLKKSIKTKTLKGKEAGARVSLTAPHAHLIELGTHTIEPRHFLRKAANSVSSQATKVIVESIKQELDIA